MMLVHQVTLDASEKKRMHFVVRVSAGRQSVRTDAHCNGVFQQPLHIEIEQGIRSINVELLDEQKMRKPKVLATLEFDVLQDILGGDQQAEVQYAMQEKAKGVSRAKVMLSMVMHNEDSPLASINQDGAQLDVLMNAHMSKAQQRAGASGEHCEIETLKLAGSGPVENFEKMGKTQAVYIGIAGPPESRKWHLGIWHCEKDMLDKKPPLHDVDLLKVESVVPDPSRHHVFVINYFDSDRLRKAVTLRRVDRARDVWVEILHLIVQKAREEKKRQKMRASQSPTPAKKSMGFKDVFGL